MFNLCSGGLETEQEYPYDAVGEKCKFEESEAVVYINDSVSISKDETSELYLHIFCQCAKLICYTCTFVHVIELNLPHSGRSVHKFGEGTFCTLNKEVQVNFPVQLLIIKPNLFSSQLLAM